MHTKKEMLYQKVIFIAISTPKWENSLKLHTAALKQKFHDHGIAE